MLLTALLVIGIVACGQDPTSPKETTTGPRLEASVVTVASNTWSMTFTPATSMTQIGPNPWGPYFAYPTRFRAVATGSVSASCNWQDCNSPAGPYDAANCQFGEPPGIYLLSSLTSGFGWPCAGGDTMYGLASGAMTSVWYPGPGDWHTPYCDNVTVPCYVYNGSSIDVTIFKPSMQVTFSPDADTAAYIGAPVEFHVTFAPLTFEGQSLPHEVRRWVFIPDGGLQFTLCPPTPDTSGEDCLFAPQKSGYLRADVIAQGDSIRFTARVIVPCPPLTDSLLTNLSVRQGLFNELALSRPNADGSNRKERYGFIVKRNGQYILLPTSPLVAWECTNDSGGVTGQQVDDTVMAGYHTHPSENGEAYFSSKCKPRGRADPWANGGGSDRDWGWVQNPAYFWPPVGQLPMYIISQAGIISRLDSGVLPANWPNNPNRWFHNPINLDFCYQPYVP